MRTLCFISVLCILTRCQDCNYFDDYECIDGKYCRRVYDRYNSTGDSFTECRVKCGRGSTLWPMPTGVISVSQELIEIDIGSIEPKISTKDGKIEKSSELFGAIESIHRVVFGQLSTKFPTYSKSKNARKLQIQSQLSTDNITFDYDTDESYTLMFNADKDIPFFIYANHYSGYRNGLVTLGQLVVYNSVHKKFEIPKDILIRDSPRYPHRGVMIDTGHNYLPVTDIINLLEGLAMSKINIVHWHVTDRQSFPLITPNLPIINIYGILEKNQFYNDLDLTYVALKARELGIRIIPEVAPIDRMGAGFEWGPVNGLENLVTCLTSQACEDRPCSQLNVDYEASWNMWIDIQYEVTRVFGEWTYHLGGDAADKNCIGSGPSNYSYKWANALRTARQSLLSTIKSKQSKTIVFSGPWITEIDDPLSPTEFIVQIKSEEGSDDYAKALTMGYDVIVSARDKLDWECGLGSYYNGSYGAQMPHCKGQSGWQRAYDLKLPVSSKGTVLGAEGYLYSGKSDSSGTQELILTRAAGLAERLWSNPPNNHVDAFDRLAYHVYSRLNFLGYRAESVSPQWCLQHMGKCLLRQ